MWSWVSLDRPFRIRMTAGSAAADKGHRRRRPATGCESDPGRHTPLRPSIPVHLEARHLKPSPTRHPRSTASGMHRPPGGSTMVHMGRARVGAGLAIAALLLGGCGAALPGDQTDPTSSTATSSTPAPPRVGGGGKDALSAAYGPAFPLTLRRTGGMAGFDDHVVLDLDGRVHVETRTVHGRVCTLGAPQLRQLVALLATLRLGPRPSEDLPSGDAPAGETGAVSPDPVTRPDHHLGDRPRGAPDRPQRPFARRGLRAWSAPSSATSRSRCPRPPAARRRRSPPSRPLPERSRPERSARCAGLTRHTHEVGMPRG